jgi:xanthine dehydrogenase molybdopterin-binding subunit B
VKIQLFLKTKYFYLFIMKAIQAKSFQTPNPAAPLTDIVIGDASNAISESKHKINGEIDLDGSQFGFYIEGIISLVDPTEDGYKSNFWANLLFVRIEKKSLD